MPFDSGGNHNLPNGYQAVTGQVIQASQHNPPLEDISASLSQTMLRNGAAPMNANLPMAGFKVTGMGDGTAQTDAVTVQQAGQAAMDATNAAAARTSLSDDDIFPVSFGENFSLRKVTWAKIKELLGSVIAGNGLTGGGDYGDDITVSLGTPGTLTGSTSNNVTSTSHTHNIDNNSVMAATRVGEVGSYALLRKLSSGTAFPGDPVAGSNLSWANAAGAATGNPTGTWECCGLANGSGANNDNATSLFHRIS